MRNLFIAGVIGMLAACSPSPNSNPPGEPTAKATPTSYTTITWDKLMPEGAYVYVVKGTMTNGDPVNINGLVNLIR